MAIRRLSWQAALAALLFLLAACSGSTPTPQAPPMEQFKATPVGTLMPAPQAYKSYTLPPNMSGVMFVNGMGDLLKVAVKDSITDIPIESAFLFILAPGTYSFYIYQPGLNPVIHNETTTAGKIRYIYYFPYKQGQP